MAKNISKLLKQAQKMQGQMMKAQQELNQKQIEGSAGGGMVKVTITGGGDFVGIKLNPEVVDPDDVEMLEDLIMAAVNNAQEEIKELSNSAFGGLSDGMKIPGL
mgnify:CR=1 FL=1